MAPESFSRERTEVKTPVSYGSLESRLEALVQESPFPWWEWRVSTNVVRASHLKVEMLGYHYADFIDKGYQAYTDLLHPDDFERSMEAMRELLEGRSDRYHVDYRIRAVDDTYHWYMDRGVILERLPDGGPELVRGIVIDLGQHVSAHAAAEELVTLFRAALPSGERPDRILTLCSSCFRLNAGREWITITQALSDFLAAPKSHGLCPDCLRSLYPDVADRVMEEIALLEAFTDT